MTARLRLAKGWSRSFFTGTPRAQIAAAYRFQNPALQEAKQVVEAAKLINKLRGQVN
ncbi:hypothetical protein [Bradyrhizobium sp. RT3a]|uniref:hypothetical protein n=1 Tax=unclassified Bradyrhizobium TaxID=2631580 RepID=UPI003399B018